MTLNEFDAKLINFAVTSLLNANTQNKNNVELVKIDNEFQHDKVYFPPMLKSERDELRKLSHSFGTIITVLSGHNAVILQYYKTTKVWRPRFVSPVDNTTYKNSMLMFESGTMSMAQTVIAGIYTYSAFLDNLLEYPELDDKIKKFLEELYIVSFENGFKSSASIHITDTKEGNAFVKILEALRRMGALTRITPQVTGEVLLSLKNAPFTGALDQLTPVINIQELRKGVTIKAIPILHVLPNENEILKLSRKLQHEIVEGRIEASYENQGSIVWCMSRNHDYQYNDNLCDRRKGFAIQQWVPYCYDITLLTRYEYLIKESVFNIKYETSDGVKRADELVIQGEKVLKYKFDTAFKVLVMGAWVNNGPSSVDSRGRFIAGSQSQLFSPYAFKLVRCLLKTKAEQLTSSGLEWVLANLAVMSGHKMPTFKERVEKGRTLVRSQMYHLIDQTKPDHEEIWSNRIIENFTKGEYSNWNTPIEIDQTASFAAYFGALFGIKDLLVYTNVYAEKDDYRMKDPYHLAGYYRTPDIYGKGKWKSFDIPRAFIKAVFTQRAYGSRQSFTAIISDEKSSAMKDFWRKNNIHSKKSEDLINMAVTVLGLAFNSDEKEINDKLRLDEDSVHIVHSMRKLFHIAALIEDTYGAMSNKQAWFNLDLRLDPVKGYLLKYPVLKTILTNGQDGPEEYSGYYSTENGEQIFDASRVINRLTVKNVAQDPKGDNREFEFRYESQAVVQDLKVLKLEAFASFIPTGIIHALDAWNMNGALENLYNRGIWALSIHDAIILHPNNAQLANNSILNGLWYIYKHREEIQMGISNSLGKTFNIFKSDNELKDSMDNTLEKKWFMDHSHPMK